MQLASTPPNITPASQQAWEYFLESLDAARAKALGSVWARGEIERAQALYYIQMLAAFGFNIYTAPRQAYPNFYVHTIFLPFEYAFGAPCPDFHYRWTFLDGSRSYRIHGRLGTTRWVEMQAQRGFWGDEDQRRLGNWDLEEFETAADGSFEIIASAQPQSGNWLRLEPDCPNITILLREALYDWSSERLLDIHIEPLAADPAAPIAHSQAEMDRRLRAVGRMLRFTVDFFLDLSDRIVREAGGRNAFFLQPMQSQNNVGGNPRAGYVQMIYDLRPDEALLIESEIPPARYWSLQLADPWWQTTDYTYHHSSLNGYQARVDADGKVRMVIAARDPGVPNWLDPIDNLTGVALWRWYLAERHPIPVTRVVPVERVREHLPPETPVVPPDRRREIIQQRTAAVRRRFGF
jgi:hypothetical protein